MQPNSYSHYKMHQDKNREAIRHARQQRLVQRTLRSSAEQPQITLFLLLKTWYLARRKAKAGTINRTQAIREQLLLLLLPAANTQYPPQY